MTKKNKQFHIPRIIIALFCLALLVGLLQSVPYFSLNHQVASSELFNDVAHTLGNEVAYDLVPIMEHNNSQTNIQLLKDKLNYLTKQKRVLDASIYKSNGALLVSAGENVDVRDRLNLGGQKPGGSFNHQIVTTIQGKHGSIGFLRMTLDTSVLATEKNQVDNTSNVLRLMILVAVFIGIVLSHLLLQYRHSHWQQSTYLLTASQSLLSKTKQKLSDAKTKRRKTSEKLNKKNTKESNKEITKTKKSVGKKKLNIIPKTPKK